MTVAPEPAPAAPERPRVASPLPLYEPLWTYVLLGLNGLVWLAMTLAGGSEEIEVLVQFGAKFNPYIALRGEYWRLVTPMFLHIGFLHLAFNSYALFAFGLDVERLFGEGHELTARSPLSQPGQYASEEQVRLIGPRGSIDRVRVLGPARGVTQVEISRTEGYRLGINAPVRMSGDLKGTPGLYLEGPNGQVEIKEGVIYAQRHLHMTPGDARRQHSGERPGGDERLVVLVAEHPSVRGVEGGGQDHLDRDGRGMQERQRPLARPPRQRGAQDQGGPDEEPGGQRVVELVAGEPQHDRHPRPGRQAEPGEAAEEPPIERRSGPGHRPSIAHALLHLGSDPRCNAPAPVVTSGV